MTNHDLIAKVGGIERATAILEGAPDFALTYIEVKLTGAAAYYGLLEGFVHTFDADGKPEFSHKLFKSSTEMMAYWIDLHGYLEDGFEAINLNDLRAAITSHKPKFKVGDLVVFDTTKPFCAKLPNDLMKYQQVSPNCKHDAIVWVGERMFEVGGKSIRHATPHEIKIGHRIELSVSPSEVVIDG